MIDEIAILLFGKRTGKWLRFSFFCLGDNLHHLCLCIRVDNSIENSLIFVLTYMKSSVNCQVQDQNRVNARVLKPGLFASHVCTWSWYDFGWSALIGMLSAMLVDVLLQEYAWVRGSISHFTVIYSIYPVPCHSIHWLIIWGASSTRFHIPNVYVTSIIATLKIVASYTYNAVLYKAFVPPSYCGEGGWIRWLSVWHSVRPPV